MEAQIFIPTKDRVESLTGVLDYIAHFHPDAPRIVIADGSSARNQELVQRYLPTSKLDIVHLQYPVDVPFIERVVSGLNEVESPTVIMSADDDFPLLDELRVCDELLRVRADAVSVVGGTVNLMFGRSGYINSFLNATRTIDATDPVERCHEFASWPYSTTYGVTRRSHLLERYIWCSQIPPAGYFDFIVGLYDLLAQAIVAVPRLTHIATRNYRHSYWRRDGEAPMAEQLGYLRAGSDILSARISRVTNLTSREADELSMELLRERFLEIIGIPSIKKPAFWKSHAGRDATAWSQVQMFRQFTRRESLLRERYEGKINYIQSVTERTLSAQSGPFGSDYTEIG